jgi:HEAT repeat protein
MINKASSSGPSPDEIIQRLDEIANEPPGRPGDRSPYVRNHLDHENDEVRAKAVSVMWDYVGQEDVDTMFDLAKNDPCEEVRTSAIKVLGRYMHGGDMDLFEAEEGPWEDPYTEHSMTMEEYERMRDFLMETFNDREGATIDERRYALESLSFVARKEVEEMIREAYDSDVTDLKVSALFAMSRTKHSKWADQIMESLDAEAYDVRFEAIRAVGECRVEEAHDRMVRLAKSTEDRPLFREAVMAVANLGLQQSFSFLDRLDREVRIDVERAFADNAMEEWRFHNMVRKSEEEGEDFGEDDLPGGFPDAF